MFPAARIRSVGACLQAIRAKDGAHRLRAASYRGAALAVLSAFAWITALAPASHAAASHPRLILTPERIATLRAERDTARRELWPAALASAEQFAADTPPAMRDANNRYRRFGDTLPALGLAFHLTGERRFVDAADGWLNAFLAVPDWRGSQNLGRSAWVTGSALVYDWLHEALPAATRAQVRERLVAEGEILLRETSYWRLLSNHCLIEVAALGLIGLALDGEHPSAAKFLATARERADLIIEHAPADGSWGEGIQYWQYGLGYFLRYLEAAKTARHHDYYPRYDWLKKTGWFPIHFSVPGKPAESVNLADSGTNDYVAGFLLYLPASVYRNGYFQDYANRTRSPAPYKFSWMDFIAFDPTVEPKDFTALPRFQHFEDNGFVMMRSGWRAGDTLIAFHAGPGPGHRNQRDPRRLERRGFGPGHAHPDTNGFSLHAHGQWLVLDPGYVREKWTRDENTIVVNGRGQAGEGSVWLDYMAFQNREPAPRILRAETNPDFDYVIGDAGNAYVDEAGVRHFRRHLLFLKPDVIVVLDDVAVSRPSEIDWLLQTREKAVQRSEREFELLHGGVRLWLKPVLPERIAPNITPRQIRSSIFDGRVTTLNLQTRTDEATAFLVVGAVLPNAAAVPPAVQLTAGELTVRHATRTWRVGVGEAGPDAASPRLRVLSR